MILTGDCRDILPTPDAESVDCCVTSPPYAQASEKKIGAHLQTRLSGEKP